MNNFLDILVVEIEIIEIVLMYMVFIQFWYYIWIMRVDIGVLYGDFIGRVRLILFYRRFYDK